jgi:hypothetical protein
MKDIFEKTRNFETNIVYYLGAGASANAIPMVSEMSEALKKFQNFIKINADHKIANFEIDSNENTNVITEFKDFSFRYIPLIISSPSLDTYAKKLWDEGSYSEYDSYKIFLSIIFNYFHFYNTKEHPDYSLPNKLEGRYENLIRSINVPSSRNQKKRIIPAAFKFFSWNYDFQLESTLSRFESPNSLNNIINSEFSSNYASIQNINGTSLVFSEIPSQESINEIEMFDFLLKLYSALIKKELKNNLKFSWEYVFGFDFNINFRETNYVVIIGYSFPTFNREIDLKFFSRLKKDIDCENENEKVKVYTQGYDFNDSVRIKRYLEQIFPNNKAPFEIIPVESPFFYVPAGYWSPAY